MDIKRGRRFVFTINNAFWENQFEEVDINNTDLEIYENYLNLSYLESIFNKQYFDFKYIKREITEDGETKNICIKRPFFKDDDSVNDYVMKLNHFRYTCWQVELGEKEHTLHIQMYINFDNPKDFKTVKKYFPTAHFEEARGTAKDCKDYCSKEDTRVRGPYEEGTFTEERARTDYIGFFEMIKQGASNLEIKEAYPSLYMRERNKIDVYRQDELHNEYDLKLRTDLEVTYIYGAGGTGKSSYVVNKYGLANIFRTCRYKYGAFDRYDGQKILVLDEFDSSMPITELNEMLDIYPSTIAARYADRVSGFNKVYIISNLSLKEQYVNIQNEKPSQYTALCRRIHNIVKFSEHSICVERGKFDHAQLGMIFKENGDVENSFMEKSEVGNEFSKVNYNTNNVQCKN